MTEPDIRRTIRNRGAGRTRLKANSTSIVRTMFVLYTLLIVGGVVLFVGVGLTQQ